MGQPGGREVVLTMGFAYSGGGERCTFVLILVVLDILDILIISTMSDSLNRLEPFLIIARSTKGVAAAKIATDATAAVSIDRIMGLVL